LPTTEEIRAAASQILSWATKERERVLSELNFIDSILSREDKYDELESAIGQAKEG
jgi:hypothetical protein